MRIPATEHSEHSEPQISGNLPAYIRPTRGKEHRIYELLAQAQKNGISLEGIEIVTDQEITTLYRVVEDVHSGFKFTGEVYEKGRQLLDFLKNAYMPNIFRQKEGQNESSG